MSIGLDWLVDLARAHARRSTCSTSRATAACFSALSGEHTTGELAQRLGADLVVVTRTGPGILNEVGLTVEVAKSRQLYVAGLVVNRFPANPGAIEDAILARLRRMRARARPRSPRPTASTRPWPRAGRLDLDFVADD